MRVVGEDNSADLARCATKLLVAAEQQLGVDGFRVLSQRFDPRPVLEP
jgi:hypothetical protein